MADGEQLHRSAQSLSILEDNNRPAFAAGKPAQTERGHVHSGVVVLHLTFGRARWVTRNHLQPVYSPALVLPRMHSCTPERSTLNVPEQKRSGRPRKGRGVPRSALPLRLHHGIRNCCAITAQSSSKSPPLEPREAADGLGLGYVPADIVFFCCSVLSNSFCGLTPQVVLMSTTAAGVRRRNTKVLCKNL